MKKNVGGEIPTNGAKETFEAVMPYIVSIEITGCADLLFHRWNCESVEAKAKAAKGSKSKKTDDIETFVYRNDEGYLCIPGEYFRGSLVNAAKFKQDPRSPRKSAMDLYKAGIVCLNPLSSLGVKDWDYEDKRRVMIQRNAISRTRPALKSGWKAEFDILINIPEYINQDDLYEVVALAGRMIGLADFRPTYGRFNITKFESKN